jgi:hypothetical protein
MSRQKPVKGHAPGTKLLVVQGDGGDLNIGDVVTFRSAYEQGGCRFFCLEEAPGSWFAERFVLADTASEERREQVARDIADRRSEWATCPKAKVEKTMLLPSDPAERKGIPITTGVLDYFPLALAEVARVSKAGNDQHNPGQPLHWSKDKSTDHADCIPRHLIDRGSRDTDGMRHSAKLAWRALALLQIELENEAKEKP